MSESVPKPYGLRQKTGPQRTFFAGIVYLYVLKKLKKNETDEKIAYPTRHVAAGCVRRAENGTPAAARRGIPDHRRRQTRRTLHAPCRRHHHAGHQLRRPRRIALDTRPRRPLRGHRTGLRKHRPLHRQHGRTVPRRRGRPLRQPHRKGALHARRHRVHPSPEQQRADAARRAPGRRPRGMGRGIGLGRQTRAALPPSRRTGRVPGQPGYRDDLLAHARQRVPHRLQGHYRQTDRGEHVEPPVLQPQGRRQRHGARQRDDDQRQPHHPGGLGADPHGPDCPGRGYAVRLP